MTPSRLMVWTIGYGGLSAKRFLQLLRGCGVEVVVDVRMFPTSKVEAFKKECLAKWLSEAGIGYLWLGNRLGGFRRGGYEAYMKSEEFKEGVEELLRIASLKRVCIMCIERDPKYCHRRFLSRYLEGLNISITHIK